MARLRVTWTKSTIGFSKRQRATIKALGLHRLNQSVEVPDNPSMRGMISQIEHLVRVEKVEDSGSNDN